MTERVGYYGIKIFASDQFTDFNCTNFLFYNRIVAGESFPKNISPINNHYYGFTKAGLITPVSENSSFIFCPGNLFQIPWVITHKCYNNETVNQPLMKLVIKNL